ncbi:NIPSNAP family protein [Ferruginibacter sp.]
MKACFVKIILIWVAVITFAAPAYSKSKQQYYQLTVYQYATAAQETVLNDYLEHALLPALHTMGYSNIGVFKSLANDTSVIKKIYVFMTIRSIDEMVNIKEKLKKDSSYHKAGATYINAVYTDPSFTRMEVMILKAFSKAPQMQLPDLKAPKAERIYELRSYESASEKIFANKVQMFNEGGETVIFKRINANAVFYSEVVAGSHMPNLVYMTCYENKADRDAHWKTFSSDPEWKTLSAKPEYQHNVAHIDIDFVRPMDYSDF